jgi:hypothetical protein
LAPGIGHWAFVKPMPNAECVNSLRPPLIASVPQTI